MNENLNLNNKVAIVTGGSGGIGRTIVQEFSRLGATVCFTYLKNEALAQSLEKEAAGAGAKVKGYKLDVRDFKAAEEFKDKVLEEFGRLDILVNNAGIIKDKALMMMTQNDWQDVIDTNLGGLFNLTRAAIVTFMKQKSGNIINISSVSGIVGLARQTNYAASKGGIIAFTRSLAREVAGFNIRVNAVAPGFIETDMTQDLKDKEKVIAQIPLSRFGKPEDVAKVVGFLAGDESGYITGQVLRVDGGLGM